MKLKLDDEIKLLQETEAFILVKQYRQGFLNSTLFRLTNPSKSEIGKISKHILDKISKLLLTKTKVNSWKNTSDGIIWFKNINNKKQSSFVNFDLEISIPQYPNDRTLLIDVINVANSSIDITEQYLSMNMEFRKTVLFHNSEMWVKITGNEVFSASVGCHDDAEACDLVGSFISNELTSIIIESYIDCVLVILYRWFVL